MSEINSKFFIEFSEAKSFLWKISDKAKLEAALDILETKRKRKNYPCLANNYNQLLQQLLK